MAFTHLLDTSVYSQPIKRSPLDSVIKRWADLGDHRLCTSIFCETELLQGLKMKNSSKLWEAYNKILKDRLPLLGFDQKAAQCYSTLQALSIQSGRIRPAFDLLIASTAISQSLILATCNYNDFKNIQGLAVEDWSG